MASNTMLNDEEQSNYKPRTQRDDSKMIRQDDVDEAFMLKDKVISIVNLLTKYKVKLWELSPLSETSKESEVKKKFFLALIN